MDRNNLLRAARSCQRAGLRPCGVLCELTNADGTMARLPRIVEFAREHDFPVLTVTDLVGYRQQRLSKAG